MTTVSKLRRGTLTLDATEFATQASNVRLVPDVDEDGDALEVLDGTILEPDETTTWSLQFVAVQDFDDPAGLQAWALTNAGSVVPFVWSPSDVTTGVSYAGNVKVRALEIGGDVGSRLDVEAEWRCTAPPTPTYRTGV